jgi:hypothetical protein
LQEIKKALTLHPQKINKGAAVAVQLLQVVKHAQMAELVDALVSGTSVGYDVQVRVLFWALHHTCAGGEIGIHATLRG